jgi:hypothetical protein
VERAGKERILGSVEAWRGDGMGFGGMRRARFAVMAERRWGIREVVVLGIEFRTKGTQFDAIMNLLDQRALVLLNNESCEGREETFGTRVPERPAAVRT